MQNTDQVRENADAARRFEPLKTADIERLRDAVIAQGLTFCADCDGRCARAAGTQAALGELTRFLTYHEHHGNRAAAPAALRGAAPRGTRLVGRRPGRGPRRVPEPSRLRNIAAGSREAPGMTRGLPAAQSRGTERVARSDMRRLRGSNWARCHAQKDPTSGRGRVALPRRGAGMTRRPLARRVKAAASSKTRSKPGHRETLSWTA